MGCHSRGYARRSGYAQCQGARSGFYQQGIRMTVIAALELDDPVTTGETARQANGAHGGLGAGIDHAHQLHGGQLAAERIRHAGFYFCRCAKAKAFGGHFLYCADYFGVRMPGNHRAPRTDIVDITFVIGVIQAGALTTGEEHRIATHALEGPYRGIYAAGNVLTGGLEQLV